MRARFILARAIHDFAPPLQPDLARKWFAGPFAHIGDFDVERIQREKRAAISSGSKQGGEEAIRIGFAHQTLAVKKRVLHTGKPCRFTEPRSAPRRRAVLQPAGYYTCAWQGRSASRPP